MSVHSVSSTSDIRRYINDGNLVVIDAWAPWCSPCVAMSPRFAQLAKDYANVTFVKFNVDEASDLASQYNITAMPTFILIKNGQEIDRIVGADHTKLVRSIQHNQ